MTIQHWKYQLIDWLILSSRGQVTRPRLSWVMKDQVLQLRNCKFGQSGILGMFDVVILI